MNSLLLSLTACLFLMPTVLACGESVASAQNATEIDIDKTTLPEGCTACLWNIADWFVASRDCQTFEGKNYLFLCRTTCKAEGVSTDLINRQILACYAAGSTSVTQEQEFFEDK